MNEVRVAIIGFGGIARAHYAAYCQLAEEGFPIKVVAVCDRNPEQVFTKLRINLGEDYPTLDPSTHVYASIDVLLANEEFDLADVCLPTFLHTETAVRLLRAGKHVLSEKPMALNSADCCEMVKAAAQSDRRLMIAHSLRFSLPYLHLKKCVEDGSLGKLRYLEMARLSEYPRWSPIFASLEKTGGVLLDMHIHDIDMLRYILGEPDAVSATQFLDIPYADIVNTRLYYPGMTAVVDATWDETRRDPFEARFTARFETATLIYEHGDLWIQERGGHRVPIAYPTRSGYAEEIRAMAKTILDGTPAEGFIPPEDSLRTVALIEAARRSAEAGGEKVYFKESLQ